MIEDKSIVDNVIMTPLKVIEVPNGNVLHGMKFNDPGYSGFGEAYFSMVDSGSVKAWKRHHKMTLNLIVPIGEVCFVIYDDRPYSSSYGKFQKVILSKENYYRLTVPPKLWLGFQGLGRDINMLLNIADIEHTLDKVDRIELDKINFDWEAIK